MHPQDIPVHSSAPPSGSVAPTLQSYHALQQQQQQQLGFSATPFQTGYPNGTSGGAAAQHPPQPYSNSANGHPSGGSPADAMMQQQARYSLYDLPTPPDYRRPANHPPAGSSSSARPAVPATAALSTTTYQPHVNADTEAVNRMIRQAMELTRNANGPAGIDFSSLDRVYDATMAEYAARAANAASSAQQPQLQQQQQQQDPSQVHLDLIRQRGNPAAPAASALPASSSSAASTSAVKASVAAPVAKKSANGSPAQAESNNEQSGTRTAASGPPSSNGVAAAAQEAARVDGESTTDKTAAQADTSKEAAAADSGSAGEKNDAQAAATATAAQPDVPEHRVGRGPGSRQRWTPEEDQELVAYVQMDPPMTWDEIGAKLGRRATGCSMRWYKYLRDRLDADGNLIGLQYPAPEPKKGKKNKRKGKEDAVAEETAAHEPSQHMVVGSSAGQHEEEEEGAATASSAPRAAEQEPERQQSEMAASRSGSEQVDAAAQAKRKTRSASPSQGAVSKGTRKASAIGTGRVVDLPYIAPDDLPPPLPPAPNKPGHPFPRAPGTRVHSNAGQHYLLKSALVENPPIPFTKNSVIRGRRTRTPQELEEDMKRELEEQKQKREAERKKRAEERKRAEDEAQANGQEFGLDMAGVPVGGVNLPVTLPMKQRSSGPGARGGTSKGGTTAHLCPAENCSAAFKRTEHLRRHYKAVHRGEKPFPCSVAGCAKYFSRKDNLQQHQAMVHFVRALYHFPDGTTSNDPPEPGEPATITFEAVDISRTPRGQQKLKRARGKQADDIFQAIRDATALAARSTAANAGGNVAQQALNAEAAIAGVAAAAMGGGAAPSTQAPNPPQSGEKRGREDDDGTDGADKDAAEDAGHIEKRLRFADYGPMGTDDTSMLDPALQALTADPSGVYGFPVGGFDPTPHDLFASLPPVPSSTTTGQAAYSAAPVASTLAAGSGNGLEMMDGSTDGGSSHGASTGGPSDLSHGGQGGVGSSLVSAQSASPA